MKHYIRSFALGLLLSGVIMVGVYYFFDDSVNADKNLDVDEMKQVMADKGYRVVSEKEYIDLTVKKEQNEQKASNNTAAITDTSKQQEEDKANDEKSNKDDDKKKDAEKDEVKEYTLHIQSGMPASEIGDMLQENGIIKDADKFNQYLEKKNYSPRVQL
ncbi:hypothetical protein P5G51_009300 [Virgibacillus sp. 179-BFC.A HS]|uniref:YceG-like family protein n=1 Tax=Tigheibacillus jepli TaxID=3035914 RepID=A0ABU5CJ61_9BACI|nr:hypothetical protein [Virgibacillus sp. 179-BFC.A HS]MDY0405563.1 hypothetical protein [Virgibacillus sp. 179-BFC.A HS]